MAQTTYPGDGNTFAAEWPYVGNEDGILRDTTGGSFGITPSGSSTTVTIATGTGSVAGFAAVVDAAVALDLASVGTEPTAGQKRVDRIALVYDWSRASSDGDTAAQLEIIPGTPVSTATADTAALPALPRTIGTRYALPLWWVSRPAGGVVTARGDERVWHGPTLLVGYGYDLSLAVGLGTTVRFPDSTEYIRSWHPTSEGTTPEWYRTDGLNSAYFRKPPPTPTRSYDLFAPNAWTNMIGISAYLAAGTYVVTADLSVRAESTAGIDNNVATVFRAFQCRFTGGDGLEGPLTYPIAGSIQGISRKALFTHGGGAFSTSVQGLMPVVNGSIWAGSSLHVQRVGY